MRRTLEVKKEDVFYRGKYIGRPVPDILYNFRWATDGKYLITITRGTEFWVKDDGYNDGDYYFIYACDDDCEDRSYRGLICKEVFDNLFFRPNRNKKYDITVKKL